MAGRKPLRRVVTPCRRAYPRRVQAGGKQLEANRAPAGDERIRACRPARARGVGEAEGTSDRDRTRRGDSRTRCSGRMLGKRGGASGDIPDDETTDRRTVRGVRQDRRKGRRKPSRPLSGGRARKRAMMDARSSNPASSPRKLGAPSMSSPRKRGTGSQAWMLPPEAPAPCSAWMLAVAGLTNPERAR